MGFPQIGLEAIFKDAGFTTAINAYKKNINEAKGVTDSAGDSMGEKFAGIVGGIGKVVAASAVLAVALATGVAAAMISTVQGASDLSETISKTGVVFGDQADKIIAFGDESAKSIGMSKNAALTAAATYGNMFRSIGMTSTASADMSMKMVTLAADLSSLNNLPTADVLDKIRAGLVGESEPLRALNVYINEASVKAKAMQMGLIGVNQELDASSKMQATYALILEQTALAQGDFGRTSNQLAGQQRILAAEWQDAKDTFGTGLLPIATAFTTALGAILDGMMPWLESVSGQIRNWTITTAAHIFYWGANMVQSLANGMVEGAPAVVSALNVIGDVITALLQSNSPPKLLPDLTLWGAAAMNSYLEGWSEASSGTGAILDQWGKSLKPYLDQIDLGGDFTNDMAKALKAQFGYSKGTAMAEYLKTYAALGKATTTTATAQADYDKALADGNKEAIDLAKEALDLAIESENQAESSYSSSQNRMYSMADAEDRKRLAIEAQTEAIRKQQEAAQKAADAAQKAADTRAAADAKQLEAADKNLEAQKLSYEMAKTDTAGKIALIDQEIAKHAEGSVEWYQLQTQKIGLEKQLQTEIAKTGTAAASITPLIPIEKAIGKIKSGLVDIGSGLFFDPLTSSIRLPPPTLWDAILNLGTSMGGGFLGRFMEQVWKDMKVQLGLDPNSTLGEVLTTWAAKMGNIVGTSMWTAVTSAMPPWLQSLLQGKTTFTMPEVVLPGQQPTTPVVVPPTESPKLEPTIGLPLPDPTVPLKPVAPVTPKAPAAPVVPPAPAKFWHWNPAKSMVDWYGAGITNALFSRPTMIGVGEAGPEMVSVMPLRGSEPGRMSSRAGTMGGGGGGDNYWVLNITTSAPTENILSDYRMLASRGGRA